MRADLLGRHQARRMTETQRQPEQGDGERDRRPAEEASHEIGGEAADLMLGASPPDNPMTGNLRHQSILRLQGSLGNAAVVRMLQRQPQAAPEADRWRPRQGFPGVEGTAQAPLDRGGRSHDSQRGGGASVIQRKGDGKGEQEKQYIFIVTPPKVMSRDELITFIFMQIYDTPDPQPPGEWHGLTTLTPDMVHQPLRVGIAVSLHHQRVDTTNPIYDVGRDKKGKRVGAGQRAAQLRTAPIGSRRAIIAEANKRFWKQTDDKTKRQLTAGPQDARRRDLWRDIQDQILLEQEHLAALPPELKDLLGGERNFQPKDYKQLLRISEKLKALDPKDLALYRLPGMADDLDALERSLGKLASGQAKTVEDPEEMKRLFKVLQEKVKDPQFSESGDSWVRFARFLEQNKDTIEGILQGKPPGKLTQAKIDKIIAEYGKYIAAEPVDLESPEKLETVEDFDQQFKYDPGWQKLSKEDRRLLLEYARANPEELKEGKVDFSRVTTDMKMSMALKLADTTLLGEMGAAAKAAFNDPAFLITLLLIVGVYVGLWLTPEPSGVTKVAAGILTVVLLAQFAWQDIYGFAKAWFNLSEACSKAKTVDELKRAGDVFLKAIGPIGFDIALAIVMWGAGKAAGPKLAKMGVGRAKARAKAAVEAAEARPGSGAKTPKAKPDSPRLPDEAATQGKAPTEILDDLGGRLSPEAQHGMADLRGKLGDGQALDILKQQQKQGLDLDHFLTEKGMSPEAKAAAKADVVQAKARLLRIKLLEIEATADPALRKAVQKARGELKKLESITDPKTLETQRGIILNDLVGEIGEAIGRASLKAEYAGKGGDYKVLGNIEAVKEVAGQGGAGYKSIADYKAKNPGVKPRDLAKFREAQGRLWESLSEADGLVAEQTPSGKLKPVEVEQVKTGQSDQHAQAAGQNTKFMQALEDIAAGKQEVKLFDKVDKAKVGNERTAEFDLSDLGNVRQSTRGLPNKSFNKSLPEGRAVFEDLAQSLMESGLPTTADPLPIPPAAPRKKEGPDSEP